jgi:transcriptional repressor NrdR
MRCPFCQQDNDKVDDTRHSTDGSVVRRRRKCCACGKKFTTYEKIGEITQIRVIKRDGSRVPFDRKKLHEGIERACWKRPISDEQIMTLITQVELDIDAKCESEVQTQFIGEQVMHYLGELDQVAYVRFASVYRQFKDADDFVRELQRMKENPDMPSVSSEYVPQKKISRFPKTKRSRYDEYDITGNLLLEE